VSAEAEGFEMSENHDPCPACGQLPPPAVCAEIKKITEFLKSDFPTYDQLTAKVEELEKAGDAMADCCFDDQRIFAWRMLRSASEDNI